MSDPSGMSTFVADPQKALGGHVVSHASQTRLMLKKGRDTARIVKLVDSSKLAPGDATFVISNQGIVDE